jgi:hypothetical protein
VSYLVKLKKLEAAERLLESLVTSYYVNILSIQQMGRFQRAYEKALLTEELTDSDQTALIARLESVTGLRAQLETSQTVNLLNTRIVHVRHGKLAADLEEQ